MKPLCSHHDEKCFLGCVVRSGGDVLDSYRVEPQAFFDFSFREMYIAVTELYDSGKKVDVNMVVSKLGKYLIGKENVYECCDYPAPSMAPQFYDTIQNWYSIRKAKRLSETISETVESEREAEPFCRTIMEQANNLLPSATGENVLQSACAELDKRLDALDSGKHETGFQTPLNAWNEAFGGLCKGHLYALAARPGLGKTALLEQMVTHYLMDERPVLVFEKDMAPRMMIERMACRLAKVCYWNFSKGFASAYDRSEIRRFNDALKKTPLLLYNPTGLTAEKMSAITRREKRVSGIEAVFLDHVGVLTVGKDLREGLTKASICIRTTTTETDLPHIILAHINRNGAKGRPTPEDIKEFDQLFGDCDGMGILWTEEDKTQVKNGEFLKMKIYFAKNRFGPVGEEDILFDGKLMAFRNKA